MIFQPRLRTRLRVGPRPVGVMVVGCALALSMVACDQAKGVVDQAANAARQAAESATADAASAAIGTATATTLSASGITLVSPPDCTSDLTVDGAVVEANGTVTCVARTTDRRAVRSVFEGSLTPTSCVGSLTINIQGREPIKVDQVDGCRIAEIVGGTGEGSQS